MVYTCDVYYSREKNYDTDETKADVEITNLTNITGSSMAIVGHGEDKRQESKCGKLSVAAWK